MAVFWRTIGKAELIEPLARHGEANETSSMRGHEVDRFRVIISAAMVKSPSFSRPRHRPRRSCGRLAVRRSRPLWKQTRTLRSSARRGSSLPGQACDHFLLLSPEVGQGVGGRLDLTGELCDDFDPAARKAAAFAGLFESRRTRRSPSPLRIAAEG